jgi:protein O-mannosyl-transferase
MSTARASLWMIGSLTLVGLCLLPTLQFGLLDWDDALHITASQSAVSARDWLLTPKLGYPIPVTVASYALDQALFGVLPLGFHLSQIVYQLIACGLFFGLSRRIGLSHAGAALALIVFALHPASAEPVSWVSGRKDVLCALFGVAAVWLALSPARWALPASVLCYALALLSKPSAAPLAVFAVVLPHVLGIDNARKGKLRALSYVVVLVPIAVLGVRGQASVGALESSDETLSGAHAAWYALGHHLSVIFLWEEATAKYLPLWPPGFTPRVDLAPLMAAVIVALALYCTRSQPVQRRVVVLGAAWSLLTYVPSSGVFFPLSRFLADSYVFLPLMGAGWIAGALLDSLRAASRAALGVAWACALALVPCFLISSARFADDERLWSHALQRFPHHRRVCRQWANGVARVRGPDPGLQATDACIERFGPELFVRNRAVLLGRLGRNEEAQAWLQANASVR